MYCFDFSLSAVFSNNWPVLSKLKNKVLLIKFMNPFLFLSFNSIGLEVGRLFRGGLFSRVSAFYIYDGFEGSLFRGRKISRGWVLLEKIQYSEQVDAIDHG